MSRRSPRLERRAALGIAFLLIVARSFVFAVYEQTFFDSDQATIGLMAKHLSEGRAFPLFMYGQPYLLGVEAWLAVPVFWVAGPTVAALRTSLILTNAATAALIILGLERWGGLRPAYGLAAAMFFCFPPPFLSMNLLEAGGGNILPLLFVLIAWPLRARPIWLGVVLAIGFLVREFTLAVVPVLLAGQIWNRTVWQAGTWKRWLIVAVTFGVVTAGVHQLRAFADPMGPGTRGQQVVWSDSTQMDSLRNRLTLRPADMPGRAWAFVTERLPELLGGKPTPSPVGPWGHRWIAWLLGVGAAIACARLVSLALTSRHDDLARRRDPSLALYLIGIGVVAAGAYIATRPVDSVVHRYFLLAVFVPIGLTALWLTLETRRHWRYVALACVAAWAVSSGVDNWRFLAPWLSGRQPNPPRQIADALESRGVRIAEATYWRAYKITFLTRERVKLASSDVVRIAEYQSLAAQEGERLRRLQDAPCPDGDPAGGMFFGVKLLQPSKSESTEELRSFARELLDVT